MSSCSGLFSIGEECRLSSKRSNIAQLYPLHFFSFGRGDGWLEEVTAYLKNNRDLFIRLVQEKNLPIVPLKPETGFLFWIDCRKSGIEPEHLDKTIMEKAGGSLNNGLDHGEDGRGFIRLNFGVTEKTLREAADRLKKVFDTKNIPLKYYGSQQLLYLH